MKRRCFIVVMTMWCVLAVKAQDTIMPGKSSWKHELLRGHIYMDDTTGMYPQLVQTVFKCVKWTRKALYTYDTTYVEGFDNKWRFMVKNNNWFDTYAGHLTEQRTPLVMNSNITSKFGAHVSYKGIGLGYMLNVRDVLEGNHIKNIRWEWSFAASRVALEAYFTKDKSDINLHRLGDYGSKSWRSYRFKSLTREAYGMYAYYIFNHRRYCHSAGYGLSRIQVRSAGSFMLGMHANHQDIGMDFSQMTDEMQSYLPDDRRDYRFRYRDYCFLAGYGYNWVPHRRWLVNITAIPSLGFRHTFPNSIEGKRDLLSTNIRVKMAAVLNRKSWFYGVNIVSDGHWYHSTQHSFFNSSQDINFAVGFRL